MSGDQSAPQGPDLTQGIAVGDIPEGGMIGGHVGDEAVLVARRGEDLFAIGATCSHYNGPLAEGLIVGDAVHCPWHHARFCLRTGAAIGAPAFNPVPRWRVEQHDGKVYVRDKIEPAAQPRAKPSAKPERVVIVGGGAGGFAAAEMLRREGFAGSVTILSADDTAPYDRPNCSKDYLAGSAPEDWMPLRPDEYYREHNIDLRLRTEVTALDVAGRQVIIGGGERQPFDKLILATGAEPVRLDIPGADRADLYVLRSLSDARAIAAAAQKAKRAVVIGASFIGLEVAASLRARKVEVHIVAPEERPLQRVLGAEYGDFIRTLHEEHGVVFHLQETATAIGQNSVTLKSGATLDADLVVVGIGVRPRLKLAEQAGLKIDRGVVVDEYLETSAPGIFAIGDIARWPDAHTGERVRIEHWVVAERHGQAVARNILGQKQPFFEAPFFWSQHYDMSINYVGHAEHWDAIEIDGDMAKRDCMVRYRSKGKVLAAASIFRDHDSLKEEAAMERAA